MINKKNRISKFSIKVYLNFSLVIALVCSALYFINEVKTQGRKQAILEAETKAALVLDRSLATHTYFSHTLKPKIFELSNPVRNENYFEPAWMSSTFAVREIDKNFKLLNNENYYYKECAINARSPENEADKFEKSFIEELNINQELKYSSSIRKLNDKYYHITLRRGEVMEEACLRCHSTPDEAPENLVDIYGPERSFNRSINEVVSAISIRIPLSTAYANTDKFSKHLSIVFIIVMLIIFAIQYIVHRILIIGPITRFNNKALNISKNEKLLGEEIPLPVSLEFGELATSFNSMSRKLRYHLDHLEEKVEKRTLELRGSNKKLQKALSEVKTLSGLLPICSHCKKIRDDKGYWNNIDSYISKHSDVVLSHGLCKECAEKHYPDYDIYDE